MCGIAGFAGPGELRDLQAMTRSLAHRGPDGEGMWQDADRPLFLGHRRLAVIDPATGGQPMFTTDGQLGVVFNGEIYNHRSLRAELEARGHRFRSDHADTEVLLHGYREWGEELPHHLEGMFAFALVDRQQARLLLVRDHFGKKPLYYAVQGDLFLFASELAALRSHRGFTGVLDTEGVQKFFLFAYIPAPSTLFKGVRKLPGGSLLRLDLTTGASRLVRWWRFRLEPDEGWAQRRGEAALTEELRGLLLQAVQRRLESDVPMGFFLSGGLDSGTVLALARAAAPHHLHRSFAIGFDEASFDESPQARRLAAQLGSRHQEEILTLEGVRQAIPQLLAGLDEPLGDASLLPTHLLCAFARRHVTVALGGDGGDELFAGYDPFLAVQPARFYHRFVPGHRFWRFLVEKLPLSTRRMSLDFRLRRTLTGLSYPPEWWHAVWMGAIDPRDLPDLFTEALPLETLLADVTELYRHSHAVHPLDQALEFYANFYLPEAILTKVDRASMRVGLEVRSPFLDRDVVDFARRLPARFKLRRGERKYLLRRAVAPWLPKTVLDQPKKGFGMPLALWMRQWPDPAVPREWPGLRSEWLLKSWREHQSGQRDHRFVLWNSLCLAYGKYQDALH
ncbi:MAG: asparagine synthase (glutamine-hydrolyzing) [Magnetococcales bacterium]|nr:asparagine synthase (glutamine-hydrolyzing) [Magnetococcales bacterium]